MSKPVTIPNTFQSQTGNIPLSQLDANFTALSTALNDYQTYANYGVDSGAVNAMIVTLSPAPTNQASLLGVELSINVNVTNTLSPTLNVNGFGAQSVLDQVGAAIPAGYFVSGKIITVIWNGTNYIWQGIVVGATSKIQSVSASVATNALTANYNGGTLDFRNATLSSGSPVANVIVPSLSITVPSTATLGTVNATQARLVLLVAYNSGTPVLCIVNLSGGIQLDETNLISPTTISASATSASVIYSASAVSANSPYRVVGFIDVTEATAGTWVTAPSLIQGIGGQALASLSSLGYGQTWQTVVRTAATYYNTTGKPITLCYVAPASSSVTVTINGLALSAVTSTVAGTFTPLTIVIPPGSAYAVSGIAGSPSFQELR